MVLREAFGADPGTVAAFVNLDRTCQSLPRDALLGALAEAAPCDTAMEPAMEPEGEPEGYGPWLDASLDCSLHMLLAMKVA